MKVIAACTRISVSDLDAVLPFYEELLKNDREASR
jgi:predicted enzyme related to lactoylglutathione lyase